MKNIEIKKTTSGGQKPGLKSSIRSFLAQDFLKNPIVQWVTLANIFLNLVSWGLIIYFIRPIDLPIVLHYNVYLGVDLIGDWWQIYFLPALAAFLLIVNFILAFYFFNKKERVAAYLFLLASFIIQAGIIIACASAILMNY